MGFYCIVFVISGVFEIIFIGVNKGVCDYFGDF